MSRRLPPLEAMPAARATVLVARPRLPSAEAMAMKAMEKIFADHRRLEAAQKAATTSHRFFGNRRMLGALPWPMSPWSSARDTPVPPAETFREWWKRERDNISDEDPA